ncbi:cleavage stimulation factor subunit 1 [Pelomyxa schiedti]|nr:cleavage stimulation factor subunit 1 [Pelomyxa schiedti]
MIGASASAAPSAPPTTPANQPSNQQLVDPHELYELVIGQLQTDGYAQAAALLSEATQIYHPGGRGGRGSQLLQLVTLGKAKQKELDAAASIPGLTTLTEAHQFDDGERCLDLQAEANGTRVVAPAPPSSFVTRFVTTHKNACRVAKFNPQGTLVATGSADTSLKLLDVEKMKSFTQTSKSDSSMTDESSPIRPVIRTFYDHTQSINELDFHPTMPILISASRDCTVKFYDLKGQVKRAFRCLKDTHNVRSVSFHPTGDYFLAGTDHNVVRLYDVTTANCYTSPNPQHHHRGPVTMVRYAPQGNVFASSSKDGSIKLWDGVTHACINTLEGAHSGCEVCSIQFSKNQRYLLSSGKDATVRLWELTTGQQLTAITVGQTQKYRLQATFNWNEDYIIGSDEQATCAVVFNSRTGEQVQRLAGHTNIVRWIAASPVENTLVTCSNDYRARLWVENPQAPATSTTTHSS